LNKGGFSTIISGQRDDRILLEISVDDNLFTKEIFVE
jgi:hypothetical protein